MSPTSPASSPPVEHVLTARARLGECPLWDPRTERLAWVDIYNHRVHQFDPVTGDDRYLETDGPVGAIALAGEDRLLLAMGDRLALLRLPDGAVEPLGRIPLPHPELRFNDGKCDSRGRFWVGSLSEHPGEAALYRYDPDGSVHTMVTGLTISNGLGWSPDDTTFYLTDSPTRKIFAYEFDAASGVLGERRVAVDLGDEAVEPDGLAVDGEGHLWSALWNGWAVVCFAPDGRELDRVELPVQRPTSLAFGGPALADLYVTTASVGLSQKELTRGFWAGDLFRISTGRSGLPAHSFAGA